MPPRSPDPHSSDHRGPGSNPFQPGPPPRPQRNLLSNFETMFLIGGPSANAPPNPGQNQGRFGGSNLESGRGTQAGPSNSQRNPRSTQSLQSEVKSTSGRDNRDLPEQLALIMPIPLEAESDSRALTQPQTLIGLLWASNSAQSASSSQNKRSHNSSLVKNDRSLREPSTERALKKTTDVYGNALNFEHASGQLDIYGHRKAGLFGQ